MVKDLCVAVEKYQKDGQEKTKWLKIGVIMSNDNGEYALLDPTIDLAGVLIKQRLMNPQKAGGSVMASIFGREQRSANQASQAAQMPPGDGFDPNADIPF